MRGKGNIGEKEGWKERKLEREGRRQQKDKKSIEKEARYKKSNKELRKDQI